MRKRRRLPLLLGAVPFLMLVFALPFVNRVEPVILGFPFVLLWIAVWVALTPLLLYLADRIGRKDHPPDGPEEP